MKKGKTRKERKRLFLISCIMMFLICTLFLSVYKKFKQYAQNENAIKENKLIYASLINENEIKKSQFERLQNPDYMERYAKEKYMYSSSDEIIIRMD